MATSAATIAHLLDHLSGAGALTARRMFGEYALYLDGIVVGFVCDDQLFLTPTPGARDLLKDCPMAPAYPGSKDYFLIDDALDDLPLLHSALRQIARDRPPPKPRKPARGKAPT